MDPPERLLCCHAGPLGGGMLGPVSSCRHNLSKVTAMLGSLSDPGSSLCHRLAEALSSSGLSRDLTPSLTWVTNSTSGSFSPGTSG